MRATEGSATRLQTLACAAAVLGDGAAVASAARLAGLAVEEAERAADALAAAGVLEPCRPLRFAQPALRAALYACLPPGDRAIAHRRAVRVLRAAGARPMALAAHACAVEPAGDESVAAALIDAGRSALAGGAPGQAALLLERALVEPPAPKDRAPARVLLARALTRLGDRRAPSVTVQALAEAAPRERSRIASELIDALWLTGGAHAALCLARRTTGGEPAGIAAARSAREGSRPAHEIVSAAADGVRGATAFERCCAIAALIACDELEMASRALAACTRAAAGKGGGAELGMLERLRARLRAVEGDEHALPPTLPGPDPGPAPWREWLDDADAVARFGTPSARAEGLIASRSGIDAFAEAVAIVRGSPRPALVAGALLTLGRALRHAGRRREARAVLGEALAIAQRLGATKLEGQVREERGVAGARPRREMLTGPASLTAAERRVAGAAVAGWTNREIADRLFLSRKTVEMHLGRVYRKLDIRSRDELPTAMSPSTSHGDAWRHDRGRIAS